MASSSRPIATAAEVGALLSKYDDPDSDIRFMTLVDLCNILVNGNSQMLAKEYAICVKTIDHLLKLLDDTNGDVQSQALKCIGPLAARAPPDILPAFIDKLTGIQTVKSQDSSIPATATRTLIMSFPKPVIGIVASKATQDAYLAVSKVLIPRLLGHHVVPRTSFKGIPDPPEGMLQLDGDKGADGEAIDLMNEAIRGFGPMLQDIEIQALEKKLLEILEDTKTGNVGKKKAVTGLSILSVYLPDSLLSSFVSTTIESFRSVHLTPSMRRLLILTVGSVARAVPNRFGPYLKTIAPFVLTAVSQSEFEDGLQEADEDGALDPMVEEVREAALITLEDFLSSCVNEMRMFTDECISASIRYLGYDPAMVATSDDEMGQADDDDEPEMSDDGGFDDEDFEEEGTMSDEDDSTWKTRRCAAKVLYSLIATRSSDLMNSGILYERIAPALIKHFNEREENVRLEIINALILLVKKTAEHIPLDTFAVTEAGPHQALRSANANSRKRRRGGSDASLFDEAVDLQGGVSPGQTPSPVTGPRAEIKRLGPSICSGVIRLFGQKSVSTKQAALALLKEYIQVRHGGITTLLDKIVPPVVEVIKASEGLSTGSTGAASTALINATGNTLRIESLQFLSALCDTHSSRLVIPYFDAIVPCLVSAVSDKHYRISCEAMNASESVVKTLTPPRASGYDEKAKGYIETLFDVTAEKARAIDTDLEVRQRAIHALSICLTRTSNTKRLLSLSKRRDGLNILEDRMKNETTRISSIQAIDAVCTPVGNENEFEAEWVQSVVLELGNQLRKSDSRLKLTSLGALKRLVMNPFALDTFDRQTLHMATEFLLPLLNATNLTHLNLAIDILTGLVKKAPENVVNESFNDSLCGVVVAPLSGHSLDGLLRLVEVIGNKGVGNRLMQDFLKKVGVAGEPAIVGLAIGTLLVSGGSSVGVTVDDIDKELHSAQDDQRRCLALSILGETGLRLGASSSVKAQTFLDFFKSKSDQVSRAAAVALGRAAVGNISVYLPTILEAIKSSESSHLLILHSVKEILQHANKVRSVLTRYTDELWSNLLKTSGLEDSKVIGAECVGRLAGFEPKKYLPLLKNYLSDGATSIRGMAIQAVRFALSDTDDAFDEVLKPMLIQMLTIMLGDSEIENRRIALTTLNSATRNKPNTILPHLQQLVPFVIKASNVDSSLIREVQMGPFKHKVDDGLEVRKSAYETLHTLLDSAYTRINKTEVFDRVVAGFGDEHEIRMLCGLMLSKLIQLDPDEAVRRLDALAERFQTVLSRKLKDNAVKQEVEKAQEANRDVLRSTVRLTAMLPPSSMSPGNVQGQVWRSYVEWVSKEFTNLMQIAEVEVKNQG